MKTLHVLGRDHFDPSEAWLMVTMGRFHKKSRKIWGWSSWNSVEVTNLRSYWVDSWSHPRFLRWIIMDPWFLRFWTQILCWVRVTNFHRHRMAQVSFRIHWIPGLGPGRILGDLLYGRGQWSTFEPCHHLGVSVGSAAAMGMAMAMDLTLTILFGTTTYGYGSIPINTIFRGMNIHLPAILMFTRGTRFWHTAISGKDLRFRKLGLTSLI